MQDLLSGYEMVVGVFLPLLIAAFIKEEWKKEIKILVSFLFVLGAAFGQAFYSGDFAPTNIGASVLKILVLTVTTYKGFWLGTGITGAIEKIKVEGNKTGMVACLFLALTLSAGMMQGCTIGATGPGATGASAMPWYQDIQNWTPHQKANFFMEMWQAENANYKAQNAISDKSAELVKLLKAKREVLEQSRIPVRMYAQLVKAGGTPDQDVEQEIIAWIRQLQLQVISKQ